MVLTFLGPMLFAGLDDSTVHGWDLQPPWKHIRSQVFEDEDGVSSIAFGPDGAKFAFGVDSAVKVMAGFSLFNDVPPPDTPQQAIHTIVFNYDGTRLALVSHTRVWSTSVAVTWDH